MSNLPRRMWSILLTCAMLLTLLPVTALAGGGTRTDVPASRMSAYNVQGVTDTITDGKVIYTVNSKADTSDWVQNSGEGSDQAYTYVGLYIDMPEGASYLKFNNEGNPDDMTEVAAGSAFLQGGKFQHWFPVAYEKEGGFGLFYGGRTYTLLLDWYNEANECILQEQVTAVRDLAPSLAVAQVGNYTYETLAGAVDAAQSGDTVELLKNTEGSGVKVLGDGNRTITIDLNGFT